MFINDKSDRCPRFHRNIFCPYENTYMNARGVKQSQIIQAIPSSPSVPTANTGNPRAVSQGAQQMQTLCQYQLEEQLACINRSGSPAWYYGIKTPQDLERFKVDFMQNCSAGTTSTMFPNFCTISMRMRKAEGNDDLIIF